WHPEIDLGALAAYLRFGYFSSKRSVFKGVRQLQPGSMLSISIDGANAGSPDERVYWDAVTTTCIGRADPITSGEAVLDELDSLLSDAVKRRMVADVPLGAFLSGGIDSSSVVALMQKQSGNRIKTFTIGFPDKAYDEAPFARAVAQQLGTDHHELYV